jgi:hypothetical protein
MAHAAALSLVRWGDTRPQRNRVPTTARPALCLRCLTKVLANVLDRSSTRTHHSLIQHCPRTGPTPRLGESDGTEGDLEVEAGEGTAAVKGTE